MKIFASKKTVSIALAGLLIILSLNFFQKEARELFYFFSSPIQRTFWKVGSSAADFLESIFNSKNLKKENNELSLKIQELFLLQSLTNDLKEENEFLRGALELGLEKESRIELAQVIGKDAGSDAVFIDKGLKDGLSNGMPIITSEKVLIGRIAVAYQSYSRVLLLSDKESSLEVQVRPGNAFGLLRGSGRSRALLDLMPKDKEIKEGDLVVFRGFLVGLIDEVQEMDVSPFQKAEISLFFDISNLNKVFAALDF